MDQGDKYTVIAFFGGAAAAGGLYLLNPELEWYWYLIALVAGWGGCRSQLVEDAANEKRMNEK